VEQGIETLGFGIINGKKSRRMFAGIWNALQQRTGCVRIMKTQRNISLFARFEEN